MLHEVVKQLTKDRNLRFRTFSPWNDGQRNTGLSYTSMIKAITHVTTFEIADPRSEPRISRRRSLITCHKKDGMKTRDEFREQQSRV